MRSKKYLKIINNNNSERSDECIDFTMMCVFFIFLFLCLSPRFGAVKMLRFKKVTPVSGRKVNLVGTLGGQNVRKNPKKVTEKREFLRKTSFRPNRFFYIVVNQKLITFKFLQNLSKTRKFT
ncbi:Uncharacterized protein FWK35_00015650, partial [Aphis craccivora]